MFRLRILALLVLIPALLAGCSAFRRGKRPPFKKLSPPIAYEMMRDSSEMLVLDLRSAQEFNSETGHLRGAQNVPLARLPFRLLEISPYRDQTILVYCREDDCGEKGMGILIASGFQDAVLMEGGIDAWIREGFKTVLPDELANKPRPPADGKGPVMPLRPGEIEASPKREVPVEPPPPPPPPPRLNHSASVAPWLPEPSALRSLTPCPPLPDGRGGTRQKGHRLVGSVPALARSVDCVPPRPSGRGGQGVRLRSADPSERA